MNIFIKKFFTLSISLSTLLLADFSNSKDNPEIEDVKEYTQSQNDNVKESPKAKKPQTQTSSEDISETSDPEVNAIIQEYTKYKNEIESDLEKVKTGKINELPELKLLAIKPDLKLTIEAIEEGANPKALNSQAYQYIKRWFLLADEVKADETGTLFYLIHDSDFLKKTAEIESLTMDEDFIPDEEFIDFIKLGYNEYVEYLSIIVDDFGDIDSNFYSRLKFKVTAKSGLNIREDPLTGIELTKKSMVPGKKPVIIKYWVRGAGKDFTGSFDNKWAKIEYETETDTILGWVNMKYLVERYK